MTTPSRRPGPASAAPTAPAAKATETATRPLLLRLMDAPAHVEALDTVATPLKNVITALEPRWLADLLHGTVVGHPVHPILAQATVGSWTSAAVLDGLALAGAVPGHLEDGVEAASSALVATGLLSAGGSFATGWTDWSALHEDQQRIGLVHAASNYAATAMFAVSLVQRTRGRRRSGRWWSLAATTVASAGAALGGHLAYRWAAGANHAEHVAHVAPEGWYRVASWDDLRVDEPAKGWIGDVPVVVVRREEGVRVLADSCSHLSASLADGEVSGTGGEACITCPWHSSAFRLDDGSVVHGPATSPQPTFDARVDGDGAVLARVHELPGVSASPRLPSAAA